jgi:hypothetical protein
LSYVNSAAVESCVEGVLGIRLLADTSDLKQPPQELSAIPRGRKLFDGLVDCSFVFLCELAF